MGARAGRDALGNKGYVEGQVCIFAFQEHPWW